MATSFSFSKQEIGLLDLGPSNSTIYSNTLSDQGLYQSIVISVIVAVCLLLLFTLLRWKFKRFYSPKKRNTGCLSWLSDTISAPQLDIFNSFGGYDAVLYLQFLKFSAALFALFSIIGLAIIVPINDVGENKLVGLSRVSIANIGQGSHLMFVHLIAVIGFSFCAYFLMYQHYHLATRLHITKLQGSKTQFRTVMVSELPNNIKDSNDLLRAFRDLWGHHVVNASLAVYDDKLRDLQRKKQGTIRKLKVARERDSIKKKAPKSELIPFIQSKNKTEVFENQLKNLNEEISNKLKFSIPPASNGFILFRDTESAMKCAQTLHDEDPSKIVVQPAPEPGDINWKWLKFTANARTFRLWIIIALLSLLFLFWSVPVTFISALSNLETLSKLKGLDFLIKLIEKSPRIAALVNGYLPTLALVLFMNILPLILRVAFESVRYPLRSDTDRGVLITYWLFLMLNVFLVTSIAGSIFNILNTLVEQPKQIINLLGVSLPRQAVFFTNYIVVESLTGYPLQLLRIPSFLISRIKLLRASTTAEREYAEKPDQFDYSTNYPKQLMIFCIALTYSTMSPVILPFATLYFILSFISAKYHICHVHTHNYEGQNASHIVMNCVSAGILIFQLTSIGVFGLKIFPIGSSILVLAIATPIYRFYLIKRFSRPLKYIPIRDLKHVENVENVDFREYTDPALFPPSDSQDSKTGKSEQPISVRIE